MPSVDKVEVELGIPGIFKLKGYVSRDDNNRKASWELYVELITRVTIIELEEGKGILREALNSIYSIFGTSRSILRQYGPDIAKQNPNDPNDISLGLIVVSLLNYVLRPFLTNWHPILDDYESKKQKDLSKKSHEEQWEKKDEMKNALKDIRETLNHYAHLLADIAGITPIHNISLIE